MKLPFPESAHQRNVIAMCLTAVACVVLVVLLKTPGVVIAFILALSAWLMLNARPDASEQKALRSSIRLSADDIADVMAEFDDFATAADADSIADRTLHRPALLDLDCADSDVEAFHYQYSSAQRFLRRLEPRLQSPDTETAELENLLKVTDQRAAEIREAWLAARRSAFRLGPNYKNPPGELG